MIASRVLYIVFLVSVMACSRQSAEPPTAELNPKLAFRPNIVWIVAEDMSGNIPAFGDSTIATPALSRLASEGVCYDNFFTPAPVCAPARSAIITGMYPISIGTHNMRTGPWWAGIPPQSQIERYEQFVPEGIGAYEAVPPPGVKMFTEFLREAGYYTSNNAKEDYQFLKTPTAWDACSGTATWKGRNPGQPFFAVFNLFVTHESQIWEKAQDSLWVDERLEVPVPPYLPDTETGRKDIRRMYSNIKEMDAQVAKILSQLEADGLLDSTIVMWYTDHGGPLPRQKRSLHDSGIKVPMIIRYPGQQFAGMRNEQMISFVDLAPTVLSLAKEEPPAYMQGKAFLGDYMHKEETKYVYAAADRYDKYYDQSRAVRDSRYKYIKHYMPDQPVFLPIGYRDNMAIMQELYQLKAENSLSPAQALWFQPEKPEEALYDTKNDPHEIHNLASDPTYQDKLIELRAANDTFVQKVNDKGFLEEKTLVERFWPGGEQPTTAQPIADIEGTEIMLDCQTPGTSIGYRNIQSDNQSWNIYKKAFTAEMGDSLEVIAHRLGYAPSDSVILVVTPQGFEYITKSKSNF